jgi:hypothetical protein
MDIGNIAQALAAATPVNATVGDSVLRSVNNLAAVQTSILFKSIGIGGSIDAFA